MPWLDRQLIAYPNPRYHKLVIAYCSIHGEKKAWVVNKMVEDFFAKNFNNSEQEKMIAYYDGLSDEERKKPYRPPPKLSNIL